MQVILSHVAKKQYNHLPEAEQKKVKKRLFSLEENPLSGKKLSGELVIYRSLRAWPYRIIYINNNKKKRVEVSLSDVRSGLY